MKVYFDESYPLDLKIMILGALFLPKRTNRYLHKKVLETKSKHNIVGELKYSTLKSQRQLTAAKEILDVFFALTDGYFKACILPYDESGLAIMGDGPLDKKRVGIYADSATKLIVNHVDCTTSIDVFMDRESRLEKANFYNKLKKIKLPNGKKFNSVTAVHSHHDDNCLIQLCDLLTGGILQNLYPTKSKRKLAKFKKLFSKYYLSKVGLKNFKEATLKELKEHKSQKSINSHEKVMVGYWHVPDFEKYKKKRELREKLEKTKSRS